MNKITAAKILTQLENLLKTQAIVQIEKHNDQYEVTVFSPVQNDKNHFHISGESLVEAINKASKEPIDW